MQTEYTKPEITVQITKHQLLLCDVPEGSTKDFTKVGFGKDLMMDTPQTKAVLINVLEQLEQIGVTIVKDLTTIGKRYGFGYTKETDTYPIRIFISGLQQL